MGGDVEQINNELDKVCNALDLLIAWTALWRLKNEDYTHYSKSELEEIVMNYSRKEEENGKTSKL